MTNWSHSPHFWGMKSTAERQKPPGVFSHSWLNKFLISCWRSCSPGAFCGGAKTWFKQPREDEGAHHRLECQGLSLELDNPQHLHRNPVWCSQAIPTKAGQMPFTGTHQTGIPQCGHQWQQWGAKPHQLWDISHLISAVWVFFTSHGFEFAIKGTEVGQKYDN